MTFRKTETENKPEYLLRLALFAFFAILLFYRLCIAFSFKHELVNGESNNIWNAMNVAHGKPIYTNPEALPLEVFQYTPLSQIPIISYAYLLDDTSPYYLYWITVLGRLTALAANCITAWLIVRLLKEVFQIPSNLAFAGGIMVLTSFTHAAFAVRPDALTLLVSTWVSIGFFRAIHSDKQRNLIVFSFLTAFAVLFKQDAFFVLVPVGIFLLYERKWYQVIYISASLILGLLLFLGAGQLLFGQFFLYSITQGIKTPGHLSQAFLVFDKFTSVFLIQFILGVVIAGYYIFSEKENRLVSLLSITFISLLTLAFTGSFKSGAWINYYSSAIIWSVPLIVFYFVKSHQKYVLLLLIISVNTVFFFRQAYFYTMPFVQPLSAKEKYIEKHDLAIALKNKLDLNPSTKLIVIDPMVRNFLFKNSIMVNMEFYGVSTFNYDAIRKDQKQAIRFLVYENNEVGIIDMLDDKFRFEKQKFKLINKIGTIGIYGRK
ncbi:MAG: ArnT family glycosyltransferase [Flavobacteriia bacterium]|jgi:hypothetical protein